MSEPAWLVRARAYLGLREIPGPRHHSKIVAMWERIRSHFRDDETPWCAAFVGAALEEAGIVSSRSAAARSYLKWGDVIERPRVGCVVVFWRGSPSGWSGHVGFVVGRDRAGNLMVLGGNQANAVTIAPFAKSRVLGYRWPSGHKVPDSIALPILASSGQVSTNEA